MHFLGRVDFNKQIQVNTLDCYQFARFLAFIKVLRSVVSEKEKVGKPVNRICDALLKGRYRFIYLTTSPVDNTIPSKTKLIKHPNLVISSGKSSERFFGMIWPLVQSLRSVTTEVK